jgi:DNA polymerase
MIEHCSACKLHVQRRMMVPGDGKCREPSLMIIGEAPASEDDTCGMPFQSGYGRVLNSLLLEARILRSDCFFTNLVRCKPPNNRVPEIDEVYACQSKLRAEIQAVNPKVIIALGDLVTSILTGKQLTHFRGSLLPGTGPAIGFKVLPTFHPSFVMRMRTMYPVLAWDLRKALKEWPEIPTNYIINPPTEVVAAWFDKYRGKETAVDIETKADKEEDAPDSDALNPWRGDIIGIAFCSEPGQSLSLSQGSMNRDWNLIRDFMAVTPCGWANNKFDRSFLGVQKLFKGNNVWDVQDGIHTIYSSLPKKLDFLRTLYTNMPPYKLQYKNTKGKYRPGELPEFSAAELACKDTDCTRRIWLAQKEFAPHRVMADMAEENNMALDMRLRGCLIDQTAVAKHFLRINPEIDSLEKKFWGTHGISISSPKQLAEFLYKRLRLPVPPKAITAKGNASTDEKAIQALGSSLGLVYLNDEDGERFEGTHPHAGVLADILRYRGLAKIASTYCRGIIQSIESDERVHPDWCPNGTSPGRWSCRGVPMQGVPEDMRDIVCAPNGKVLMGADYKGIQIFGAAVLAEDWELAEKMLNPGYALHNDVMEAIRPYYPSIKKIQAKTVVFGTFFGRSIRDIAQVFHVPMKTAQLWQDIFYSYRPKLKTFFEDTIPAEWKAKGYIETMDGRKVYCERITEAKSVKPQNFESVIVKGAMRKLIAEGYTPILMVHDQIVCEEPEEHAPERFARFIEILENIRPDLYKRFPVVGGIGPNWYAVK